MISRGRDNKSIKNDPDGASPTNAGANPANLTYYFLRDAQSL